MYGTNICFLSEAFLRLKPYVENSVKSFPESLTDNHHFCIYLFWKIKHFKYKKSTHNISNFIYNWDEIYVQILLYLFQIFFPDFFFPHCFCFFFLCGRRQGWDDLRGWHWNMYIIIYETNCQVQCRYRMLGAGALGWVSCKNFFGHLFAKEFRTCWPQTTVCETLYCW